MILVDVAGVTATRPERDLFRDVTFTLSSGDRLGILGINGVGKSTLLRVMTGETTPESGTVRRGRDVRIAQLEQRPDLGGGSVRDAIGEGWEVDAIIDRLGMSAFVDRPVDSLSGGQAKRVALALSLLAESDLLVLDEPTNHLDIGAIEWLERRLTSHRGGLVLVTHDRLLLDRLCTRVLLLTRDGWELDEGGYQAHLDAEAERVEKAAKDERSRRTLARQELAWLQRGAKARRRKPRSRIAGAKAIIEGGAKSSTARGDALALDGFGTPRLGDQVIDVTDVSFAYDVPLLADVDLSVGPGDRIGIIGPNGAGKSTLLDLMAGRLSPQRGEVTHGTTISIGYFDQLGRELDGDRRVRELLAGDDGKLTMPQQQLLERFWFDRDAQQARVGSLSGGERRRLELLLVLAEAPNVLFLDEPTNDLDLDTLRALEGFLDDWSGSLVTVSHDRIFLERVTDVVVEVAGGAVRRLGSGASVWEQAGQHGASLEQRPAGGDGTGKSSEHGSSSGGAKGGDRGKGRPGGRSPSTLRRLISAEERTVAGHEQQRGELEEQLAAAGADHVQLAELGARLDEVQRELDAAEERWIELSSELEDR